MSATSSRVPSSEDAIQNILNDPDVYMKIRPTRNSNACASCRKKKKRCEPGVQGPNTTCQRCSDYGLECKYEYLIGQRSPSPTVFASSPSPPPSHQSSPHYNRRNPSVRSGAGTSWSHREDTTNRTASHGFLALSNTSYLSPSHSGDLPPSVGRARTSPLMNTHGVLHQGNIYPNMGTNPFPPQGFISPLATTEFATNPYIGSPLVAPQFGQQPGGNNSFGSLTQRHNGQEPMNFVQQTPPTTCECTLETTCYLHKPHRSVPTDTSDFGWTQNSYFQQ